MTYDLITYYTDVLVISKLKHIFVPNYCKYFGIWTQINSNK